MSKVKEKEKEEINEQQAEPVMPQGQAPEKPETKEETRLFQTASGREWLTKKEAKEKGFHWS